MINLNYKNYKYIFQKLELFHKIIMINWNYKILELIFLFFKLIYINSDIYLINYGNNLNRLLNLRHIVKGSVFFQKKKKKIKITADFFKKKKKKRGNLSSGYEL